MPKGCQIPQCSEKDRPLIEEWVKSRTMESDWLSEPRLSSDICGEPVKKIIQDFITVYWLTAKPFTWRKREVTGSHLKNTIVNLRN